MFSTLDMLCLPYCRSVSERYKGFPCHHQYNFFVYSSFHPAFCLPNEFPLLLTCESLDFIFSLHCFRLSRKTFCKYNDKRAAPPCIFSPFSRCMHLQAMVKIGCVPGIKRTISALENIDEMISNHK